MTIGILVISHDDVGSALLRTATNMIGQCPFRTETIAISHDSNPDEIQANVSTLVRDIDTGDGVLVLTDIYGSTPSNIAMRLNSTDTVKVIAGMNLPMLVRILNYPDLDLESLAASAVSGGKEGILLCNRT